jgi:lipopolysaccharide kinase (Kdo/WaaP) family protein
MVCTIAALELRIITMPITSNFISLVNQHLLSDKQADRFDTFWNLKLEPIDTMNTSRKGWSQACILRVPMQNGNVKCFVVKKQQNFNRFSWAHPVHGVPTLVKEHHNIQRYQQYGIPTVKPVYFARRKYDQEDKAILITEYLEKFQPLNNFFGKKSSFHLPANSLRKKIIKAVALHVKMLHKARLVHRHLYLKHIFVRLTNDNIDVRFIDLEASQKQSIGFVIGLEDLATLNRTAQRVKATDRLRFIYAYFGINRLDRRTRKICRKILKQL